MNKQKRSKILFIAIPVLIALVVLGLIFKAFIMMPEEKPSDVVNPPVAENKCPVVDVDGDEDPNLMPVVVLKERIYVEYGIKEDPCTQMTIIQSHVLDEFKSLIPKDAVFTYDPLDTSVKMFNYQERAASLGWDPILSFIYSVDTERFDELVNGDPSKGLEKVIPLKGAFTLSKGDYNETFEFEYYVIEIFAN